MKIDMHCHVKEGSIDSKIRITDTATGKTISKGKNIQTL